MKGAEHTDFLRTAVGEIYLDGNWLHSEINRFGYSSNTQIPQNPTPGAPIVSLDSLPLDEIAIRPPTGSSHLPSGTVPTAHIMQNASIDGIFYVESATFLSTRRIQQYSFESRVPLFDSATLQSAVPARDAEFPLAEPYRALVHDLAVQITEGHDSAYAKAKAIESYLQENYAYAIADESTPPVPPDRDPVDWFLFESREGTCGNFSSAFVQLARAIGLPARVVSGFAITPTLDEQIVFADQAHQRAEIAFEGLGWVSFEPTPDYTGAPGRADEYSESGEASGYSEQVR